MQRTVMSQCMSCGTGGPHPVTLPPMHTESHAARPYPCGMASIIVGIPTIIEAMPIGDHYPRAALLHAIRLQPVIAQKPATPRPDVIIPGSHPCRCLLRRFREYRSWVESHTRHTRGARSLGRGHLAPLHPPDQRRARCLHEQNSWQAGAGAGAGCTDDGAPEQAAPALGLQFAS